MKKSINILGAFDRYNYGDLLFPIIIEEYFNRYHPNIIDEYKLEFYGLIDSDLSELGGKKTKRINRLYQEDLVDGSVVIVSGGEVLGALNRNLYLDLCGNYIETIIKRNIIRLLNKVMGEKIVNKYFCIYFGIKSDYPWIIEKDHFNGDVNIVYNTVGGRLPKNNTEYYRKEMINASYISIREIEAINKIGLEKAHLAPDSASIISRFFPEERLLTLIKKNSKEFVSNEKNYICIQTNLNLFKENKSSFIEEIEKIVNSSHDIEVLLLPIGFATNHDDLIALRAIKRRFSEKVHLIEDLNIYDIMYLISKSKMFIGSSLHGNITAMSYCIPHIGIGKKPKLESYLNTWDIREQNHCIKINEIYMYFEKLLFINTKDLNNKKVEIENLVVENFEKMIDSFV